MSFILGNIYRILGSFGFKKGFFDFNQGIKKKFLVYFHYINIKGFIITFTFIHLIHFFSVFIYGGFLFVDNLFLSKISQTLNEEETSKAREAFMMHVRKVVPWSLLVAVASGLYLITQVYGPISDDGLNNFQIMLSIKAFFGLWLGIRGFNQKFFKINPFLFTFSCISISLCNSYNLYFTNYVSLRSPSIQIFLNCLFHSFHFLHL